MKKSLTYLSLLGLLSSILLGYFAYQKTTDNFIPLGGIPAANDVTILWDTAQGPVPAGWTCASCADGDPFWGVMPHASSSYANATSGADGHANTVTFSTSTGGTQGTGAGTVGTPVRMAITPHYHTWGDPNMSVGDNRPPYKNLEAIYKANATTIPANAIIMLATATIPTGFTYYSGMENKYLRLAGDNATGGATTHTHGTNATTTSGSFTATINDAGSGGTGADTHTNSIASGSLLTTATNNPAYIGVVFASNTSGGDIAFPTAAVAIFTAAPPSGWTATSTNGSIWASRFIMGSSTFGNTGGNTSTTHSHGGTVTWTSGGPSATRSSMGNTGTAASADNHTHDVTYTVNATTSLPIYRDTIFATKDPLSTYTLTVNISGVGTVTSSPAGITCPGTCSADYTASTQVNLTATPASTSTFTSWSGACTTATSTCNITMTQATSVTATFTAKPQGKIKLDGGRLKIDGGRYTQN